MKHKRVRTMPLYFSISYRNRMGIAFENLFLLQLCFVSPLEILYFLCMSFYQHKNRHSITEINEGCRFVIVYCYGSRNFWHCQVQFNLPVQIQNDRICKQMVTGSRQGFVFYIPKKENQNADPLIISFYLLVIFLQNSLELVTNRPSGFNTIKGA